MNVNYEFTRMGNKEIACTDLVTVVEKAIEVDRYALYEGGELEFLQTRVGWLEEDKDNMIKVIGKLIDTLCDKGMFTVDELNYILYDTAEVSDIKDRVLNFSSKGENDT